MAQNPYIAGNPVGKTNSFVGRSDILREVLRVLDNSNQNTLVLFGQRRIGKTSILQYLEANLSKEGVYHPIYFDLQDKAAHPLPHVIKELAGSISNVLGVEIPNLGKNVKKTFQTIWLPEVLESLKEGHSLVILFDEFNVLSEPKQDQAFTAFFPYLRSLLSLAPDRLQFVFVIGRNIDDIGSDALSLLKGTLSYSVSLLSHDDATSLIRLAEKQELLNWEQSAIERVLDLTNGHPFLTQQICSQIFEDAYDTEPSTPPTISVQNVENILAKVINISGGSLEWLWEGLSPAGKVIASALAKAGPQPIPQDQLINMLKNSGVKVVIPELMDAPTLLEKWDLIQPADEGYVFRVELLRQWIAQNKPLKNQIKEMDLLLPVAQNLYQVAVSYYSEEKIDKAVDLLTQAISKNPTHLHANELLADIYISQNKLKDAQETLERLMEYHPLLAKTRLVGVLLQRAITTKNEDEKLECFERVIDLDGKQREALAGKKRIWKKRAEEALKTENYSTAMEAYNQAGLVEDAEKTGIIIRDAELKSGLEEIDSFEKENNYSDAISIIKSLSVKFPKERKWNVDLKRLERKIQTAEQYQRALGAMQSGNNTTARELLLKVVELNPSYEEASRYLHLAITGVDVEEKVKLGKRLLGLIAVLFVILLAVSNFAYQENATTQYLQATINAIGTNENDFQSNLTARSQFITATFSSQRQEEILAANTATAQGNVLATQHVQATSTALAIRLISDSTTGKLAQLRSLDFPSNVNVIDFSPDSTLLAAGLDDGTIYMWEINSLGVSEKELFAKISDEKVSVASIAFSPDGQYLLAGASDGRIRIWNIDDGLLFKILNEHNSTVTKVLFSQDGNFLASISRDDSARIWKTGEWSSIELDLSSVSKAYADVNFDVIDTEFSPDGEQLAVSTSWSFRDQIDCNDITGTYNCTNRSTIFFFTPNDGKIQLQQDFTRYQIHSIKYAPVSPILFFSSSDNYIHSYSLASAEIQTIIANVSGSPRWIDITIDGNYLIALNNSCDLTLWRVSNREKVGEVLTDEFGGSAIGRSANNMYLTAACRETAKVFGVPYLP